ncbi:MAG TPA: OB-fold nucleic acid binding domain-containing protein [Segeticoccus sp.]|uniref:OB-fold nucleic acid binding domain-containing protein n=1 Tax=Segeticoccus sp. TaxID=2706531 RepID=UPI002D80E33F|nr:OB-fold nucleic acid binding domain-containing protein [Segeticoccus sp.]HET8601433.1 OB-fold nucleic acid binding domain-containing protein [Segeticoccus sp.]
MARATKVTDKAPESGPRAQGLLTRVTDRLTRSEEELEARELQEDSDRLGGTPIAGVGDRQLASVCGTVRSVTLRPRANVPALVAELYDGSRSLNVVWLGRRRIAGIAPGTYLTVRGRVTYHTGTPTIFNPAYEIITGRGHAQR